jgi:three-Cys-motif partner protein
MSLNHETFLGLGFVDMLGFEVTFETIRSITAQRNLDLAFTFHVGDLNRNLADALTTTEGLRLDQFFGSEKWRDVVRQFDLGGTGRSDCTTALADFYGA